MTVISLAEADGLPRISPAWEPMECQEMIGWGALPHCQELWKGCKRMMRKTRRMANASLKQSVTSLFAEWVAWPEMRSNVGLRKLKEIEAEETGQKAKIYIAKYRNHSHILGFNLIQLSTF